MGIESPDPFSEAVGLSGPLGVRLGWPGLEGRSTFEFRRPYLVVGRDRSADLVIDRPEVSRRHAYFQVVAGEVFCVDLGSRTGVRWGDGTRPAGWVDRDRGVEIGPARIRFDLAGAGVPADRGDGLPISRSFRWGSLPGVVIEFLGADSGREPWPVSRALVLIGRSPVCRVQLPGPGIARIHAALIRTPDGAWVVDLLGPGGLRVEDVPTRRGRLEDGDRIAVGDHQFRVRLEPGAGRPSNRTDLARSPAGPGERPAQAAAWAPPALDADDGPGMASRIDPKGVVDPLTARLLDEFDRMHRRTTEQFQQAILMMFRMHQDQMDVIRDELGRLDRLEEEQKYLQAEVARGPAPPPHRITLRLVSGGPSIPPPDPADPDEAEVGRAHPTGASPAIGPIAAEGPGRGEAGPSSPDRPGPGPLTGPDQHALLVRRIAEIKEERRGLWRKLLAALMGDGPEGGAR